MRSIIVLFNFVHLGISVHVGCYSIVAMMLRDDICPIGSIRISHDLTSSGASRSLDLTNPIELTIESRRSPVALSLK